MSYTTPADLADYLGEDAGTIDTGRAELLIDLASADIDHEAGQTFAATAADRAVLDGNGTTILVLPAWPVTDVSEVVVDGASLTAVGYRWSAAGLLRRVGAVWPDRYQAVEVTYDHGYAVVPGVIRSLCLQAAARGWTNPGGMASESIGSYSYRVREANATGVKLTPGEAKRVRLFTARRLGV